MTSPGENRRGGGRRLTIAALGALAVIGALLVVFALTSQVGEPPQPELRTAAQASDGGGGAPVSDDGGTVPGPSAEGAATPRAADEPSEPREPAEPAEPAEPEEPLAPALTRSEPTTLRIDSLSLEAEVFPLGLGPDGALLAPSGERAHDPAWFDGSPTPGEVGPSVIEGHVTWGGDPSIFFELGALRSGDRVEVDREDGTTATFEVYDTARFAKDAFPTVAVYGRTDGPELRLITCGGELDDQGHHLDNTVVFLRLIEN